jgi:xanthine dehydrogenase YagS FAD-binding subunit
MFRRLHCCAFESGIKWRIFGFGAADGARPLQTHGFKVELIERSVERQLATVAGLS